MFSPKLHTVLVHCQASARPTILRDWTRSCDDAARVMDTVLTTHLRSENCLLQPISRYLSECFATNYMYFNRCCRRRRWLATAIYDRASTIDNINTEICAHQWRFVCYQNAVQRLLLTFIMTFIVSLWLYLLSILAACTLVAICQLEFLYEYMDMEFRRYFWQQKTSPWAIVRHCLCDPRLAIFVELRLVTDGQTDGHIWRQRIPRRRASSPMSVLLIVGPKSMLAVSHAAPWWVTMSMPTGQKDIWTDRRQTVTLRTLFATDAASEKRLMAVM